MTTPFPEPASTPDLRGGLLDYLDFYRGVVGAKLDGLGADGLRGRWCRRAGPRPGW